MGLVFPMGARPPGPRLWVQLSPGVL